MESRRANLELNTPAELAIHQAMFAVSDTGSHPLLTEAVDLLIQARSKVADFVDSQHKDSPMDLQSHDCDRLCDEIRDDVCNQLPHRMAAAPGVVGAMISADAIKAVVRTALDFTVQLAGPAIEAGVIANEDQIKAIVSPAVLSFVDRLIHGLNGGVTN